MTNLAMQSFVAVLTLVAIAASSVEAACPSSRPVKKTRPLITIESPAQHALNPDQYENGARVIYVTGRVKGVSTRNLQVAVDGQPAATAAGGYFAAKVPADTSRWFQPILVEATDTRRGAVTRERRIVFHGDAEVQSELSPNENAFVHVTSAAFDQSTLTGKFEPQLRDGIQQRVDALDISATLRGRNPVAGYRCLAWAGALCHAWLDEANIHSVSFSPVSAWAQSISPAYGTAISFGVSGVAIDLEFKGGINSFVRDWWCRATVTVDNIGANVYLNQAGAFDGTPGKVLFWQPQPTYVYNSPAFLQFYAWSEYPLETGAICPDRSLEWGQEVNAMLPGLLSSVGAAFDVGRPYDNPLPRTLTDTVEGIRIVEPIAAAVGKTITTAYGDVNANTNQFGITYPLRTKVERRQSAPCAPQPVLSYAPRAPLPSFTSRTTPVLGAAYDLALGLTPGAFNRLLTAMVQEGALTTRITEQQPGQPLTVGAIRGLFAALPKTVRDDANVVIDVYPTVAPVVDNLSAPDGSGSALLDLRHMAIDVNAVSRPGATPTTLLRMAFDLPLALDLTPSPDRRTLTPAVRVYDASALELFVLQNPYRANEPALRAIVPSLVTGNVGALAGTLGAFSLGEVSGFALEVAELRPFRTGGGWMEVFLRLVP